MNNSFFDDKTAVNYCVSIISFDDDYYYAQLYCLYDGGFKQFLCNVALEFDDFPQASYFHNSTNIGHQTFTDFEIEFTDSDSCDQLMELIAIKCGESEDLIHTALKKDGKTIDLIVG